MENKFAAQLFTLREELKKGIKPVFKKLSEMGWAGIQISALPSGYDPYEVSEALQENNLGTAGMHVSLERLEQDLENVLAEAKLFNTKDLVCPFISQEIRTIEGYKYVKERLNDIARRAEGFRISYHNHAFEFETEIEGKSALEYLLDPDSENQILAEIDVFWVKKGGQDPLSFIQKYAQRMPIIHLKDMTKDDHETFAEVGTGKIDFLPILKWCESSGVQWYAVEQDKCPGNPMDSLQKSLDNLKEMSNQLQTSTK
ncbi:xylose isomerase [Bacillus sp. SA1-12]|uniref:sugar phosphate isomerase/epimerase family protein n=1 Tax=Bacillus sp. SA1-12 TaxID=1455638 RepID=UPI0006270BDE|nr:sugar phosphate isomerase/epimerase [Bacillus sp. SA1-12]KKI89383.1 xylose isomerase [Bacillus sp. SA1-12]